ncbi:MAG: hypothetical protein ACWA5L_04795 [bacterium]
MSEHSHPSGDKPGWADNPVFLRLFSWGLYLACAGAAIAGFIWKKDHPHFDVEGVPVFFAIYGFVMFFLIVVIGQHLRKLVARGEEYYDERE